MGTIIAVALIALTGPENQRVDINPQDVVSLRAARGDNFDPDVKCLIHMADGKFVAVVETCDVVRQRLGQSEQE